MYVGANEREIKLETYLLEVRTHSKMKKNINKLINMVNKTTQTKVE